MAVDVDKHAVFGIVAFPSFEAGDREWIESIRARFDPQTERIAAHVSLVFPVVLSRRMIEAEAARVGRVTEPIKVVFRRAAVVQDSVGGGGHVFLIPDEGRDAIKRLHDRLYEGALGPHLRTDVTFAPHITVATRPAIAPLDELAAEINARNQPIRGFVSEMVVVEVTPAVVQPVAHFQLGTE